MIALLRDAPWIDADRAQSYARVLAILMTAALLYSWVSDGLGHHPFRPPPDAAQAGKPQPGDFVAFWSAGRLAAEGHAATAYDFPTLRHLERQATALPANVILPFYYPPPFLLLLLPFALLPYFAGFMAFILTQAAALLLVLRRIVPRAWGWLPLLSFPGLLMNAATGQNGCVTATLFALPVLLLESRPFLAGLCLGGLVIKPQLAPCVPVALLAARRWRAIAGAAVSSGTLLTLSIAIFGAPTWRAFLASVPAAQAGIQSKRELWGYMQSLYAALRIWGAPAWLGYGAQTLCAAAVLAAVAAIVWRRPGGSAEAALMAAAALLCTPYLLDYDLALAAVPLAWLAQRAARGAAWLPWERLAGAAAFLWPLVGRHAPAMGLTLGPLVLLGLFAAVCRRARRRGANAADPA